MGLLKEGQAVSADVPGLASVLANLLCTVLPVLQVHEKLNGGRGRQWHTFKYGMVSMVSVRGIG